MGYRSAPTLLYSLISSTYNEHMETTPNDILIVCYSGTGCSELVARTLAGAFEAQGSTAQMRMLRHGQPQDTPPHDLLVVVYAVHACNAPQAVYDWIAGVADGAGRPAAVLSVSGGGEVSPNTACRVGCIRRLRRKGYDVRYDRMVVMPSNWIVATAEPLAVKLLEALPGHMSRVAADLLSGVVRHSQPLFWDRALSALGELEKPGARLFGRHLRSKSSCTGCGWCAQHCPAGNIAMRSGRPVFGAKCHLCLCCVYGCPRHAIRPALARFVAIPQGFSLAELQAKTPWPSAVDIPALTRGYLWSGVRKYLLNPDD